MAVGTKIKERGTRPLLELKRILATPKALGAMEHAGVLPRVATATHRQRLGDLFEADRRENVVSICHRLRILTNYKLDMGATIWIMTEVDRSAAMLLLPEEY